MARFEHTLHTRNVQMGNKHMRRCSTLLVITEIQIKSTMKYHYMPIRMAKLKRLIMPNPDEDVGKLASYTLLVGKYFGTCLKVKHTTAILI